MKASNSISIKSRLGCSFIMLIPNHVSAQTIQSGVRIALPQDKTSPNGRQWLTPEQFSTQFSPSIPDGRAVVMGHQSQ
jgi:hypothetical protein